MGKGSGQLPSDEDDGDDAIDVRFDVPFTHRLRFTRDVLGADARVLIDLLDHDVGVRPRVLPIVERGVDAVQLATTRLDAIAGEVELLAPLLFDGGERSKNDPALLVPALRAILDGHVDRRSYVLAIGGGALLDAVGFAAALAHRGVRLIRLPTTTLAQADSGVGVKNAINFFGRKNWLGTFAVPWAVINDAALLATLPDRDWRCGFSEAVKVALLKDAAFFDALCDDASSIAARDPIASDRAIRRSARLHLDHITRGGDPFEHRAARPLDFGHWSAHRLEAMSDFAIRHGEAVAIGVAIDCAYSTLAHGLPTDVATRVIRCLNELGLSLTHPSLADADALLDGLEEFREHLGGRLTITMLRAVNAPIDVHAIDRPLMRRAIERVRGGGDG